MCGLAVAVERTKSINGAMNGLVASWAVCSVIVSAGRLDRLTRPSEHQDVEVVKVWVFHLRHNIESLDL